MSLDKPLDPALYPEIDHNPRMRGPTTGGKSPAYFKLDRRDDWPLWKRQLASWKGAQKTNSRTKP